MINEAASLGLHRVDLARMIDISAVRTPHGEADVRELAKHALEENFIAAHVLPCWVGLLRELLDGSTTMVGAPVGFPAGAHATSTKVAEARQLMADGVQEMDMVVNVGMLKSGRHQYVLDDLRAVIETAAALPVKVILEVPYLTADEIKIACEMVIKSGAAFIKTSTGWASDGATLEVVRQIMDFVGDAIKVKAAGGIRDLPTVQQMLRMGVSRFGINTASAIEILRACQ